jgi:hypothetical protein
MSMISKVSNPIVRWCVACVAAAGPSLTALADTYTLPTLNVQNNTPSMDRPVPNGDNPPTVLFGAQVPYDAQEFYTTVGGAVSIDLNAAPFPGFALMIFVYADVFDPTTPLTNCIEGFGDSGGAATRSLSFTASAHRRYILVVTPYNTTRGEATGTITSPGLIVPIRSNESSWIGGATFAPTFNRPVANGVNPPAALSAFATSAPYTVRRIWVSAGGRYTFFADSANPDNTFTDLYVFVYSGSFDPASPLSNCLIGNDDLVSTRFSGLSVTLPAAGNYYVVTTTFDNGVLQGTPPLTFYTMPAHSVHVTGRGRIEPGPFCAADFNRSNLVSVQDIFDFLEAFFNGCN